MIYIWHAARRIYAGDDAAGEGMLDIDPAGEMTRTAAENELIPLPCPMLSLSSGPVVEAGHRRAPVPR